MPPRASPISSHKAWRVRMLGNSSIRALYLGLESLRGAHMTTLSKKVPRLVTQKQEACRSSPATICYWFAASLCAWGLLSLLGVYWHPLHASSASTILFAMAIGCAANWLRNFTFHCAITGPIFLIAGFVFLLPAVVAFRVSTSWVWPFILIAVGVAFLLEWRYAKRPTSRP